jgi:hypothetical protein
MGITILTYNTHPPLIGVGRDYIYIPLFPYRIELHNDALGVIVREVDERLI